MFATFRYNVGRVTWIDLRPPVRDALGAEERAFYARRQEKTPRAPTSTPFSALMRMQKGHRAYADAPFIDKDGRVLSIEKTHGIPLPPPSPPLHSIESDFLHRDKRIK